VALVEQQLEGSSGQRTQAEVHQKMLVAGKQLAGTQPSSSQQFSFAARTWLRTAERTETLTYHWVEQYVFSQTSGELNETTRKTDQNDLQHAELVEQTSAGPF